MTAVSHAVADDYLQRPDPRHFFFLVFGEDQGLVSERVQRLLAVKSGPTYSPLEVLDFSGDWIASAPSLFLEEINSFSLFENETNPVRITLGSKSIIPVLETVSQSLPPNRTIVIQGGDLKRDALIRKWFESQKAAVSIECRFDQTRDIQQLIDAECSAANIRIDADARDLLVAMLGEDRLVTRMQIKKLLLYTAGYDVISVRHINDCLSDASVIDFESIIIEALSGDLSKIAELLTNFSGKANDFNRLLSATIRHTLALHRARVEFEASANFDASLQYLLRSVNGYGRKRENTMQLRKFSAASAETLIPELYYAVKKARQSNTLNDEQLVRSLFSLARLQEGAKARLK